MKRIALLLLVLAIALCGCSAVNEDTASTKNTEDGTYVYDVDSGGDIPGTEIPLEEYKKAFEEDKTIEPVETEEKPTVDEESEVVEEKTVSATVYRTKSGEKYHRSGCQYLNKSKIETTVDSAKAIGLSPCSKCSPPR